MRIAFLGGLNEQQQPSLNEAAAGSQNFDLNKSTLQFIPRAPVDLVSTAPNGSSINGIMQLVKRDNSETTIIQAGKDIYQWDGSSTWSVKGSVNASSKLRDVYWALDDYLIITDISKVTPVSKWSGSVFGTLATGLGSTLYAKYGIVHLNRVWLANCTIGSTEFSHVILVSQFETPTNYNSTKRSGDSSFTTGQEAFFLVSPDLKPINGMATFYGSLIISTVDGRLYKLTGSDSTDFAFIDFYPRSNAAGDEALINTGNDLLYMKQGGAIESLIATQTSGDVATDDLSRWIPTSVDGLTGCIPVYDQLNQKVLFFTSSKVLVLFKDFLGGELSPWSLYKTGLADSFNTNAARYLKIPGTQNYTVMFGGSAGQVYDLNGVGLSGDGGTTNITAIRKTRSIDRADGIDFWRKIVRGRLQYRRKGSFTLAIQFDWADEFSQSVCNVPLEGTQNTSTIPVFGGAFYFGGSNYFNTSAAATDVKATKGFSAVGRGPSCEITFSADTTVRFQIDYIDL